MPTNTVAQDTTSLQLITTGDKRPSIDTSSGNSLTLESGETTNLDGLQNIAHSKIAQDFTVLVDGVVVAYGLGYGASSMTTRLYRLYITLVLDTVVQYGQSVAVAYQNSASEGGAASNRMLDFPTTVVDVRDTTSPQLITTGNERPTLSTSKRLILRFSGTSNLDQDHKPASGAFTVLVEGIANTVTDVLVAPADKSITLVLATPVRYGQRVSVNYQGMTTEVTNIADNVADPNAPQLLTVGHARPTVDRRATGAQL
ncbi:hypothetical protein D8B24_09050 [Verminephrobacter aporrectodeae subsp. tuberculatae]|uniref:SwmB domain-containing protein n=1 Tax=Verminephrobacter aporrectodeae TaxID=1110389 RepID=UPI002243F7B2|nr:SwmB domain-containing protein [Verminephrobacter aporrectodeae]MCW8207189.1 hypothetical protein [Verminephrobacter aporrectodeae subsp. tuberculatae]